MILHMKKCINNFIGSNSKYCIRQLNALPVLLFLSPSYGSLVCADRLDLKA